MADHTTARRAFPYPDVNTGKVGGPTGVGAVDTKELAEAMDGLDTGYAGLYTTGLVTAAEWNFGTFTINSGTGALTTTLAGAGIAWLPDPNLTSAMIRTVTPATKPGSTVPPSLPATTKYMAVCLEFVAPSTWGSAVTFALASGVEKATQREAELALPAQTAGRLRYSWVVIKNSAGVYSIAAEGLTLPEVRYNEPAFTGVAISGGAWASVAPLAGPVGPKTVLGPAYFLAEGAAILAPGGMTKFLEPNPTRPTFVMVSTENTGFKHKAKLLLQEAGQTGCKVISEWTFRNTAGTKKQSKQMGFICPAGAKWALYGLEIGEAEKIKWRPAYVTL